jgi:hypothetical protein
VTIAWLNHAWLNPDFEKVRRFGGTHHSSFAGLAAREAQKA